MLNRLAVFTLDNIRPFTSAVEPLGGRPGVVGGKLWFMVVGGTRGEKAKAGRLFKPEDRKRFRGVEAEAGMLEDRRVLIVKLPGLEGLLGLSPGILVVMGLGVPAAAVEAEKLVGLWLLGGRTKSDTVMDWDSLLDGP